MKAPFTITYNPDWRKRTPSVESDRPDDEHSSTKTQEQITIEPSGQSVEPQFIPKPNPSPNPTEEPGPLKDSTPLDKTVGPDQEKVAGVHLPDKKTVPVSPQDRLSTLTPEQKPRPRMNVTWEDTSRKLRKKGHPPPPSSLMVAPPTPEPTPEKTKSSLFSRLSRKPSYPRYASIGPTPHPVGAGAAPPSPPSSPGWKHHESYFPEYTPIYPTTTFTDPYARPFLLTPAEIQAQQHAARVGHAVAVHYPMLPPFNEYASGAASKGQGAWQSGQWGNSNWTGFGLNGERLPDAEGKTFSAPMPKGVLPEKPKAAGAGGGGGGGDTKKKGGDEGGGGGGGAAAEGSAPDAAAAAPEGDAAPAAEGGGGGGGAKKKKKK